MIDGLHHHAEISVLTNDVTFGLGELEIEHPAGTFAISPASLISV